MHISERIKKGISALLCLCMLVQNAPMVAFAAEDNLCKHHPKHTAECHYAKAVAGVPCTHSHDEFCGYAETVEEVLCECTETDETGALVHTVGCGYVAPVTGTDCTHTHDTAVCGYVEAAKGSECTYVCQESHEEEPEEEPEEEIYPGCAHHNHDDSCGGIVNACSFVCGTCVEEIQSMVNDLPDMEDITNESKPSVAQALSAIDARKCLLSDAGKAAIDFDRYADAAFAMDIPENFFGFYIMKRYEASAATMPQPSFAFLDENGAAATVIAAGGASVTSVSPVPNGEAVWGYLPVGTYTLEESVEGQWNLILTVNGQSDSDHTFTGESGRAYSLMTTNNYTSSFEVNVESSAHGEVTVTVNGEETSTARPDETVELIVNPDKGYKVVSVSYNDTKIQPDNGVYSFSMPAEDVTIKADFEKIIEYPVWVAGIRVTSENMADILGDGTVSYDPATFTLYLNDANIQCTKSNTAAILSQNTEFTLKIVGTGTNIISAISGSGIYAKYQNISIRGGTFVISGSAHGVCSENGSLTIDGAQVKASGASNKFGAYPSNETTVQNGGGLLAVNGSNATIRGSYTMGTETFDVLSVAKNATLTIKADATVTVNQRINADVGTSKIQIEGTLKLPAGSGRKTMSGGTLYIGDKGYQWDATDSKYYCITHDWAYRLKTGTTNIIEAYCKDGDVTNGGTLKITAKSGTYSGSAYKASLDTSEDWKGPEVSADSIKYQYRKTQNESYVDASDRKNTGFYEASITVDDVTASVAYEVTPKALTIGEVAATDRVYAPDNTEVTVNVVLDGIVSTDNITATATGTLADANAGTDKTVSVTITLSGNDAHNYSCPATATTKVTIQPRSLNADGITAVLSDDLILEGAPIPTLTVKDGDTTLTKDTDYTVTKTGSEGLFTLTVEGKGNYKDVYSGTLTYLVVKLPNPNKVEPDDEDAIDAYDRYSKLNETYKDAELTKALKKLKEALTDYDVIKGHKSSYTKGSGKTFAITANGYFGKFTGLKVDGKLLNSKYYTAKSGSTIVTLKNSYLDSLSDGKHTIEFLYTDGTTGGDHYFRISTNNGSPFTGDNNHIMMLTGIMMTSLMCMVMMIMFVPKKKGKYQR